MVKIKYEIGQRIKDDKRDLTIINRKIIKDKKGYSIKYYQYKCNKCGFDCNKHWSIKDNKYKDEYWIVESGLKNSNCACCQPTPQIVVEGINSIYKTDKWMIPYIGEECAKTHTHSSHYKVKPTCPNCKRVSDSLLNIKNIYKTHSIGCSCSDGVPYPEKFVFSFLEQLKLDFQTQLSKTTCKWCDKYKYDFYFQLNNELILIETHGLQHYEDTSGVFIKTIKEETENDKIKKELALLNGIKEENYIVIDCRYSTLEWIRDSILNNKKITDKFNLSKINWIKCGIFAESSRVKEACDYWNEGIHSTIEIGEIMKLTKTTIRDYLKKGTLLSMCDYSIEESSNARNKKSGKIMKEKLSKQVEVFKDKISLGIFPSLNDLERKSEKLFGFKLNHSNISSVCNGKTESYKGLKFLYT